MSWTLREVEEPERLRAAVEVFADTYGTEVHRRHRVMASAAGQGRGVRGWLVEGAAAQVHGILLHRGTPPVLLALAEVATAPQVARLLSSERRGPDQVLPPTAGGGVELLGAATTAEAVARALAEASDGRARRAMGLHLLVCRQLRPPDRVCDGAPRRAEPRDAPVVAELTSAFIREALPHRAAEAPELGRRAVEDLDGEHGLTLWEEGGQAVALARLGVPAAGGRSISLVYTPPRLRGRGYASGLVAALTAEALAGGAELVDLSTDVDHPFSTRLYEALGFERVGAHASWVVEQ